MTTSELDEKRETNPSPSAILLVFLVYVAGTTCEWGFVSWWGLLLVLAAAFLAFWFHARPEWRGPAPEAMLQGIFIACVAANCFLRSGLYENPIEGSNLSYLQRFASQHLTAPGVAIKVLAAAVLLLAVSYFSPSASGLLRHRFAALILIAVALRALTLFSTPPTDVFAAQTEGAKGLLEGQSVYKMIFTSMDKPGEWYCTYPYPPAVLYCNCISWRFFKDVRGLWVVCDLLAAWLMYLLARRSNPGEKGARLCELLPLTFLFLPRSLFVIWESWTEPLVVVSMAGFALAAASGRGRALTGCLLGLWFSSKQYAVVAVPLALKLLWRQTVVWLYAVGLGLALVLPFVIWSFRALMQDIVVFFLRSPGRPEALSLYGLLLQIVGVPPPGGTLIGVIVACLWIGGIAWFTWKMPRNLAGMLFATASAWIFFFLLGKQAFINYFYVVAFALLLAVAASPGAGSAPGGKSEG